jgi:hypothetical protein
VGGAMLAGSLLFRKGFLGKSRGGDDHMYPPSWSCMVAPGGVRGLSLAYGMHALLRKESCLYKLLSIPDLYMGCSVARCRGEGLESWVSPLWLQNARRGGA